MFTTLATIPARPLTGAVTVAAVVSAAGGGATLTALAAMSAVATTVTAAVSADAPRPTVAAGSCSVAVLTWAVSTLPAGVVCRTGIADSVLEGLVDFDPDFTVSAVAAGCEFGSAVLDGVVPVTGSGGATSDSAVGEVGVDGADGELAAELVCAPPVLTTAPGSAEPVVGCDAPCPVGEPFGAGDESDDDAVASDGCVALDDADEDEAVPSVSAAAVAQPYPVRTAVPTPRTTANLPTRPTHMDVAMFCVYAARPI
jgi:hypothetical protein